MGFDDVVATAWLINDGKVLLQKRGKDATINPGGWGSFGGHIEPGETPEVAVVRELMEELQIKIKPEFFGRYTYDQQGRSMERFVFLAHVSHSEEDLRKLQIEGDDLGFFSVENAKKLLKSHNQDILDEMVKSNLLPQQ